MNNNIGFRVKFDDYIDDRNRLKNFLELYFSKFDILEVKVNDYLTKNNNLEYLLSELEHKNNSFHLSKNFVNKSEKSDDIILSYINNRTSFLITHVPNEFNEKDLEKRQKKISKNKLLFENQNVLNNKNNINQLIEFYNKLLMYDNFGVCLDLGHLYYNELITNNYHSSEKLLDGINNERIFEYHLHDFNKENDHLVIGTGLLASEQIDRCLNNNARIILETNVNRNDLKDGEEQVKRVLTRKKGSSRLSGVKNKRGYTIEWVPSFMLNNTIEWGIFFEKLHFLLGCSF